MALHPHQKWTLEYDSPNTQPAKNAPVNFASKVHLKTNRLYARVSNLFIRTKELFPQAKLNATELRLQTYLNTERQTNGNGSPINSNPQQVFTFSATDETPINTIFDDFMGFVDLLPEVDNGSKPSIASQAFKLLQRVVDSSHKKMVNALSGGPSFIDETTMILEQNVTAQGFLIGGWERC